MAGMYRPRHPERTVHYRVLFHHFERFVAEYEGRFEREYGYFRPIVKEVVEKYLDCGNPRCGFALMNRSRFMRTAKRCPHEPKPFHEDCEALPSSGVRTAVRSGSLCSPAAPGDMRSK